MSNYDEEYWAWQREEREYSFESMQEANATFVEYVSEHADPTSEHEDSTVDSPTVLDCGCGLGYLQRTFEREGWKTTGVDVSSSAIRTANESTAGDVAVMDVDGSMAFADESFDVVSMFDVIEHLENPYRTLREIHRVLVPGGIVAIHCPNANAIGRLLSRSTWFGEKDETHKYMFTPYSLSFLARRTGFEVRDVATPFRPLPDWLPVRRLGVGGAIVLVAEKAEYE